MTGLAANFLIAFLPQALVAFGFPKIGGWWHTRIAAVFALLVNGDLPLQLINTKQQSCYLCRVLLNKLGKVFYSFSVGQNDAAFVEPKIVRI